MSQRREASVIGDKPSVWVGDLYRRGEPNPDNTIVLRDQGPDGARFKFSVIPEANGVRVVTTCLEPFRVRWHPLEQTSADVEWVDWSFGSRRPYILCARCLRRVSRAFVVTMGCQAHLYCRRCAGVRYRSQDASVIDQLCTRIDEIRTRLGGEPVFGKPGTPIPVRPRGMQYRTYFDLAAELKVLEGELSGEYETNALALAGAALAVIDEAQKRIDEWKAMSGPFTPPVPRKRRHRAKPAGARRIAQQREIRANKEK
jgi:hypothetical protein